MKTFKTKLLLLCLVSILFTSCKKNYTCVCTMNINGSPYSESFFYGHKTKAEAQKGCDDQKKTIAWEECKLN